MSDIDNSRNVVPPVLDQFEEIRDNIAKRILEDGKLLIFLNDGFYQGESGDIPERVYMIVSGYSISIKKLD